MLKICNHCGVEFNAKRSSAKYCSRECQHKSRTKRVKVKCDYCGKEIEKIQCRMKTERHFCDQQCRGKWDSENRIGENHHNYTKVKVKCDYCGKEIEKKQYDMKYEHHFCNDQCRSKWNIGENHPTYAKVKTTCATCGKKITIQKTRYKEGSNYCSIECQHKGLIGREHSEETKQLMREVAPKGENSPHWNKDKTDEEREQERNYTEYHQWKKAVKERDDYTCQCCGKRGGKLHSHHLNGYHWDKEHRHDVDNGVTLCTECHKDFHNIYGNRNNTKEQYEEWISNKHKEVV